MLDKIEHQQRAFAQYLKIDELHIIGCLVGMRGKTGGQQERRDPGFVGMKLHPSYTNTTLNGTDYDELCAYWQSKRCYVA